MVNIFVAGKTGQLAFSLIELADEFGVNITCHEPPELDLTDSVATEAYVIAAKPDMIINAAAYTAVDKAENDKDLCFAINEGGTKALAKAASALNIPMLHVSTDYVFEGSKEDAYLEDDSTGPTGVYGSSKLAGDIAAASIHDKLCTFRTAWVYSPFGNNFLKTMLHVSKSRDTLGVVGDQWGNPTYAPDIARGLLTVAKLISDTGWQDDYAGTYHMVGTGDTTWHGFASEIFEHAHKEHGHPMPIVKNLTTEEYPTPTKRPANSRLNCNKLHKKFGVKLPHWTDSTKNCIDRLFQAKDI